MHGVSQRYTKPARPGGGRAREGGCVIDCKLAQELPMTRKQSLCAWFDGCNIGCLDCLVHCPSRVATGKHTIRGHMSNYAENHDKDISCLFELFGSVEAKCGIPYMWPSWWKGEWKRTPNAFKRLPSAFKRVWRLSYSPLFTRKVTYAI